MRFFSRLSSADPYERAKILIPAVFILFVVVVGGFIADSVSEDNAREQLLAAVNRSITVRFEGRTLDRSTSILAVLRSLHHVAPHHTGPTNPLCLELVAADTTFAITIARDSDTPGEYWVYRPGHNWHNDPLGQEAGRINNPTLDTLLPWPGPVTHYFPFCQPPNKRLKLTGADK